MFMSDQSFSFHIPLEILKGGSEDEWRIGGVASTEDKDFQGEVVKIDGLDISSLASNGFFNQDHKKGFENILGKIDFAEKRQNDQIGKYLYVEGSLFKTQPASSAAWNIMKELKDDDRKMQLSVEGKIIKREGKDKKTITQAKVENVALTLNPINKNTFATFLKSMEGNVDSDLDMTLMESKEGEDEKLEILKKEDLTKKSEKPNLTEKEIHDEIKLFFKDHSSPPDTEIHKLGEKLGLDADTFEEHIYMVLSSYINKDTSINKSVSQRSFKQSLFELCKGMSPSEVNFVFDVIRKSRGHFPVKPKIIKPVSRGTGAMENPIKQFKKRLNQMGTPKTEIDKQAKDTFGPQQEIIKEVKKMKPKQPKKTMKAMEATASYATQLPQERTGGDVMTQESLARKKKKKTALKTVMGMALKSFPTEDRQLLSQLVLDRYKILSKGKKK